MKNNFKIQIIDYRIWIPEFLCAMIVYFSFLNYTGHIGRYANDIALGCSLALWCCLFVTNKIRKKEFIFIIVLSVYTLLFFLFGKGSLQLLLRSLPVAIFLLTTETLKSKLWVIIPWLIVADLLVAWIGSPNKYFLYQSISRNYISVFVLYALAIYIIYLEKNNRKINLIYIFLAWAFSISAVGRGGIIATSAVLILFITQRFFANEKTEGILKAFKVIALFIALTVFAILISRNLEYIQTTYFGRFFGTEASASSSSAYRSYMILEYIKECKNSFGNFLFGCNADLISSVDDNLHNSYLQLHSKFGLLGLLFVLIGSIKSLLFMLSNKSWQYAFIFFGILLRAVSDWCFPGFPTDFLLLFFITFPYFDITNKRRGKNETNE